MQVVRRVVVGVDGRTRTAILDEAIDLARRNRASLVIIGAQHRPNLLACGSAYAPMAAEVYHDHSEALLRDAVAKVPEDVPLTFWQARTSVRVALRRFPRSPGDVVLMPRRRWTEIAIGLRRKRARATATHEPMLGVAA